MKRRSPAVPLLLAALAALAPCGIAHAQWNSCGVPLCTTPQDQYLPVTASDNAGGAIVAWADHRNPRRWMVYAARVSSAGAPLWAADGVPVAPDTALVDSVASQQGPAIIPDGAGGAFITWVDGREYPYSDIYAQHINASGVPQWATKDGGIGVCKAVNVQQNPTLVLDGSGGVVVVWQDCRNGTDFDIYAQRVDATGAPQWTTNGVALCTANDSQLLPKAIPDGTGGAIVVWYDYRSVTPTTGGADVYAQRVDGTGATQWNFNGVAIYNLLGEQTRPNLISDGAGGAIIAWEDSRSVTSYDIYAQRINSSGLRQWGSIGIPICTAANNQNFPTLCPDGAGGAIITWQDLRKGPVADSDIYAQRVNAAGITQWAADGVPVCTAANNQQYPIVVAGSAGDAIIAWYDERGSAPNMFAQRLDASGAAQWAADGVEICGIPYGQSAHSAIADGAGGAIVAWQDGRTNNSDIYAARVDVNGGLGVPSTLLDAGFSPAAGLELSTPWPNPTRRAMSVRFVLAAAGAATLDLIDVSGRFVERHEVGSLGPGAHTLQLGADKRLHAGLYFVRLRQGGRTQYARASVIP